MKSIKHIYKKENNYYTIGIEKKDKILYKKIRKKVFIKKKNKNVILKIKINKKYKFLRIYFKILILDNIWFGKFSDTEDLILLKEIELDKHYDLIIYQSEWQHRFMLLDLIKSNPNIYL